MKSTRNQPFYAEVRKTKFEPKISNLDGVVLE